MPKEPPRSPAPGPGSKGSAAPADDAFADTLDGRPRTAKPSHSSAATDDTQPGPPKPAAPPPVASVIFDSSAETRDPSGIGYGRGGASDDEDAGDEDEDEGGSTRSIAVGSSGAAASVPRSIPSVPRVGIPRSLRDWDRYEVQSVLGAGGMGAVYKARDPRLGRMVALKIIHPMLGESEDTHGQAFVRRFNREARLQASLDHPYICKISVGCRNSDGIA